MMNLGLPVPIAGYKNCLPSVEAHRLEELQLAEDAQSNRSKPSYISALIR